MSPLCPYFSKCSGCQTQHLPYPLQLENKRKALAASIGFTDSAISDILVFPSSPYGYRTRMDFIAWKNGIGLRARSGALLDVACCPISSQAIQSLLTELRSFFSVDKRKGIKGAYLRSPPDGSGIVFILEDAGPLEAIREFASASSAKNIIACHDNETSVIKGSSLLSETLMGKKFFFPMAGFFQNNHEIAEKMHAYVHALLQKHSTKDACLLDLYAGVGTFGIINASLFSSVKMLESYKPAVDAAAMNIKENNITDAEAICLEARQLNRLKLPAPLLVITDPPRSGMEPKVIDSLKKARPEVIVYISCNIRQLGKDIRKFKSYTLKSAAMFDMFPQTNHVEAVVELAQEPKPI